MKGTLFLLICVCGLFGLFLKFALFFVTFSFCMTEKDDAICLITMCCMIVSFCIYVRPPWCSGLLFWVKHSQTRNAKKQGGQTMDIRSVGGLDFWWEVSGSLWQKNMSLYWLKCCSWNWDAYSLQPFNLYSLLCQKRWHMSQNFAIDQRHTVGQNLVDWLKWSRTTVLPHSSISKYTNRLAGLCQWGRELALFLQQNPKLEISGDTLEDHCFGEL